MEKPLEPVQLQGLTSLQYLPLWGRAAQAGLVAVLALCAVDYRCLKYHSAEAAADCVIAFILGFFGILCQ
jgi:hypothetical protein